MKKKNYEAIADIVKAMSTYIPERGRKLLAGLLADYFTQENGNFNSARFLAQCGVITEEEANELQTGAFSGICTLGNCQNKAHRYGVCKTHMPTEQ